jgi:hypothetical protein
MPVLTPQPLTHHIPDLKVLLCVLFSSVPSAAQQKSPARYIPFDQTTENWSRTQISQVYRHFFISTSKFLAKDCPTFPKAQCFSTAQLSASPASPAQAPLQQHRGEHGRHTHGRGCDATSHHASAVGRQIVSMPSSSLELVHLSGV